MNNALMSDTETVISLKSLIDTKSLGAPERQELKKQALDKIKKILNQAL